MTPVCVVDVGRAAGYVCARLSQRLGVPCVAFSLPVRACTDKRAMRNDLLQTLKDCDGRVVTACVTCASVVPSLSDSILPVCRVLEPYRDIVLLSTSITANARVHEKRLKRPLRYIAMDGLLSSIEARRSICSDLRRLRQHRDVFKDADCVVLACTHFCMHSKTLSRQLRRCGFRGRVIDVVTVLVDEERKSFLTHNSTLCLDPDHVQKGVVVRSGL